MVLISPISDLQRQRALLFSLNSSPQTFIVVMNPRRGLSSLVFNRNGENGCLSNFLILMKLYISFSVYHRIYCGHIFIVLISFRYLKYFPFKIFWSYSSSLSINPDSLFLSNNPRLSLSSFLKVNIKPIKQKGPKAREKIQELAKKKTAATTISVMKYQHTHKTVGSILCENLLNMNPSL